MNNKILTVAIIGVGSRGANAYGMLINQQKDKFKIVALCDLKQSALDRFGAEFGVEKENLFLDEKEFFLKKRADLLIIATPDADHYRHAITAFNLKYDVLMEKPITDKKQECLDLLDAQKRNGVKALVCHVLRYAPPFVKLKELIDSGIIGKLIGINATEGVHYWHQAHSYVRGNWRSSKSSTPMILAKCCHDLDLLVYYTGSKCKTISSVGNLDFFKVENAPKNSADRCTKCVLINDCPYSAKDIYINAWKEKGSPKDIWPYNVIAPAPLTEEKLYDAIENGPYGRCAFKCDNDVVDNQITVMEFENGVKAELTMTAFLSGRRYVLYGTYGNIVMDEESIAVTVFGKPEKSYVINLQDLSEGGHAHGGGDNKLIDTLYDVITGVAPASTALSSSIESHLMGILAEESRLNGGKTLKVHE